MFTYRAQLDVLVFVVLSLSANMSLFSLAPVGCEFWASDGLAWVVSVAHPPFDPGDTTACFRISTNRTVIGASWQ